MPSILGDTNGEDCKLIPYKTDYLYRSLSFLSNDHPVILAVVYFFASFGIVYIIGLLTGQFFGKNGLEPMYMQHADNFNIGFLAPLGAGLLCKLYHQISNTIQTILNKNIIKKPLVSKFKNLISTYDAKYNSIYAIFVCLTLSLYINGYHYVTKVESWLGEFGGLTGIYGRLIVCVNYFMIFLVVYKCILTITLLQKILDVDIKVNPMHPDRSGGLESIGNLAMAVNYFLALITIYITILLTFDPLTRETRLYFIVFIVFYLFSIFAFFASLFKAHKKMGRVKNEILGRLEKTSEYYYDKLFGKSSSIMINLQAADEIVRIDNLYGIVEKMPVWPFNFKYLMKFFSAFAIPLLILLVEMFVNTDSLIYNMNEIFNLLK